MPRVETIRLDYGVAASKDLLCNLSGCAFDGEHLWTVSDEGGSLECLRADSHGFTLAKSFDLRALFRDLPGRPEDELDLESIDVADGHLLVCGSHCRVRRKPEIPRTLEPRFRNRRSRRLLGRLDIGGGASPGHPRHLPFEGKGSLRERLGKDRYLGPFLDLPSKENGLDIEGMTAFEGRVLLGLRGPVLDGVAVVVDLDLGSNFVIGEYRLHFLALGGLGIRDLARLDDRVAIIAGPVGDASGPFRLFRWGPRAGVEIQAPDPVYDFASRTEKPEGCCALPWRGRSGLLVLADSPDHARLQGTTVLADWVGPL